jgi:hypothetical protein
MSMNTSLKGRLRNTTLHNRVLMPPFEAVVNSIHAIAEESSAPPMARPLSTSTKSPSKSSRSSALNAARERNRALFDKPGLPAT